MSENHKENNIIMYDLFEIAEYSPLETEETKKYRNDEFKRSWEEFCVNTTFSSLSP